MQIIDIVLIFIFHGFFLITPVALVLALQREAKQRAQRKRIMERLREYWNIEA